MKYQYTTTLKCQGCISKIQPTLDSINEIKSWSVEMNAPVKVLTIEADSDISELVIKALSLTGYAAEKI
jgi:copper chaperone